MVTPLNSTCPGCGVRLPVTVALPDVRSNASPECQQLFSEVSAYTLTLGDAEFIHQLAVDAYAAQHASEQSRPITTAFALIGLYLACERNYSGRQVQHMHQLLANRTKTWPSFVPPLHRGVMTVFDVVQSSPGTDRDAMLRRWGKSVWDAWGTDHAAVLALLTRVMAD